MPKKQKLRSKPFAKRVLQIISGLASPSKEWTPHETNNPFKFSDGTDVDDSNFMYKWEKYTMAGDHPVYKDEWRCTIMLYIYIYDSSK